MPRVLTSLGIINAIAVLTTRGKTVLRRLSLVNQIRVTIMELVQTSMEVECQHSSAAVLTNSSEKTVRDLLVSDYDEFISS